LLNLNRETRVSNALPVPLQKLGAYPGFSTHQQSHRVTRITAKEEGKMAMWRRAERSSFRRHRDLTRVV